MKRLLCLTLTLLMLMGLCACSEKKPAATATVEFQAGFGRVDITPNYSVPLAGYGNTTSRMSQGFLDYLYATCIALKDAKGQTVLFVTADIININDNTYKLCVEAISSATKVPKDHIIVSATHTHSAPDLISTHSSIVKYKTFFVESVTQACIAAIKDLSAASVSTGSLNTESLTFVRHYLMNDGTYYGDNFGSTASGYKAHERDADEQMQLIKFTRSGKDPIVMINWQAHAKVASTGSTQEGKNGRSMMSADYIGSMRNYVEKEAGCLVGFYLGAAGNLNPRSNMPEEQSKASSNVTEYGKQLGNVVLEGMKELKKVSVGPVVTKQTLYEAAIDHTEDDLVKYAQPVAQVWEQTNNYNQSKDEEHGVMSPYHALGIINRANAAQSKEMQLNAISIGSVGFVTAPYEMFCQNGQAIKEGSPFETTFVITCTNGHNAYIAADSAFEYGSYEVHYRTFVRGTAEAVQAELIGMLNALQG